MGLSNESIKARSYSQTINQNQGGGNKKAGFPYMIGRETNTSIAFNNTNVVLGKCCKLDSLKDAPNKVYMPMNLTRGVGGDVRIPLR
jgi:hypothetical protein